MLLQALKEQQAIVRRQQAEKADLKARLEALEQLVNPVPRTYVRGFGAMPFRVQNIHPRTYVLGFLWYGVKSRPYLTAASAPIQ